METVTKLYCVRFGVCPTVRECLSIEPQPADDGATVQLSLSSCILSFHGTPHTKRNSEQHTLFPPISDSNFAFPFVECGTALSLQAFPRYRTTPSPPVCLHETTATTSTQDTLIDVESITKMLNSRSVLSLYTSVQFSLHMMSEPRGLDELQVFSIGRPDPDPGRSILTWLISTKLSVSEIPLDQN